MTSKRLFYALLFLGATIQGQNPSVYQSFDDWPLVKLNGGKLICTDYVNVFRDEFNDAQFFNQNWNNFMGNSPTNCGLAHGSGQVFSQNNVLLNTTAVTGGLSGQVELSVTKVTTTADANCDPNIVNAITRKYVGGVIQMQNVAYNLGRYSFRCQFPSQSQAWTAFWMFHNGVEIDIVDNGFKSNVNHNVFQNDLANQILNSPCNPFFSECNFCPSPQGIDCHGLNHSCSEPNGNDYDWPCNFLADGFHEFVCEWTPYKISFSVDGHSTGTIFRYYNLEKIPVNIECGDQIPELVVKENPAYASRWNGTWMQPIIWVSTVCCETCDCILETELPTTLFVDNFIVDERVYQVASLDPGCYILCPGEEVCMEVKQIPLNFLYSGSNAQYNPLPPLSISDWEISSINATVTSSDNNSICLTYTGNGCPDVGACLEEVCIRATYAGGGSNAGSLAKCIYPPQKPKFFAQCNSFSVAARDVPQEPENPCFCVDLGNNCDAIVVVDDQQLTSNLNGGLRCYTSKKPCGKMEVTIDNCGELTTYSSNIFPSSQPPFFPWGSPVKIFNGTTGLINNIFESSVSFCYLNSTNPVDIVSVNILSKSGAPIVSFSNNCVQISNISVFVHVLVTFERCGNSFTQMFVFFNNKHFYKIQPNPTSGNITLTVEGPIILNDLGETPITITPLPEFFEVNNALGQQIIYQNFSPFSSEYQINISAQMQGIYKLIIHDATVPEGKIEFQILKQ
jgi:beta-glucanase (GH16 family)